jgi:dCMP deaminase
MVVVATAAEQFRQCSRRGFFALIVDKDGMQIGSGWNGVPAGMTHCLDGGCPRGSERSSGAANLLDSRLGLYDDCWATHAEANALLHTDWRARQGGTMYVSGAPCFGCAKLIANSGLRQVVCTDAKHDDGWDDVVEFLVGAGVSVIVQ